MGADWTAAEMAARRSFNANAAKINATKRGIPAGRDYSRSTTSSRGYKEIKAQYRGKCQTCKKEIHPGKTVRYWFNHGVTCRSCIL